MDTLIDFNAVRLAAAVLFLVTSLALWLVLYRQHDRGAVALWALGGLGLSLAMMARLDNGLQVQSVLYVVSAGGASVAFLLRVLAMRRDLGLLNPLGWSLATGAAVTLPLAALAAWSSPSAAVLFARVTGGLLIVLLAGYSWQLGRRGPSRNGMLLAGVEALTVAAYLLVTVQLLLHWDDGLVMKRWDYAVFSVVAIINAAYSNLAYIGLVLDRTRVAQARAHDAQVAESVRRNAAEKASDALRGMLRQRDQLVAERGHLLQVLAHEIRQPLHNANLALQAAAQALRHGAPHKPDAAESTGLQHSDTAYASARLQRAQAVLGDMQSVLDNTLAVSSLLAREVPLNMQEVEIDFLLDLALGDLPEVERARVSLQRHTSLLSLDVEPGLVRLALRNLLRNAFNYSGTAAQVSLCIDEQADPPALRMRVLDNGIGLTPAQLSALSGPPAAVGDDGLAQTAAQAAAPVTPQRGLGLFIVRRVMALHNGRLTLTAAVPQGLVASLVFPLPGDDKPTAVPAAAPQAVQALVSGARNT